MAQVPAIQLALFEAVAVQAKKLVVVVMAGGPVDVSVFKGDSRYVYSQLVPSSIWTSDVDVAWTRVCIMCQHNIVQLTVIGLRVSWPCDRYLLVLYAVLLGGRVAALIVLGYPGMQGGRALADTIFGKVAPSGRLPVSIYR